MEHLYIVIYRTSDKDRWQPKMDGCFASRELAAGFTAALRDINPGWKYEIVEGSTLPPDGF